MKEIEEGSVGVFFSWKMERKQGFFSALKEEVVRGLSPGRSRARSPARSGSPITSLLRRKKSNSSSNFAPNHEQLISRSGSLRPLGETLTPLMEGPDPDGGEVGDSKRVGSSLGHWMKGQLSRTPSVASTAFSKRSDLRLLLGVMGAPLAPVHVSSTDPLPHLSIKDTSIVSLFVIICKTPFLLAEADVSLGVLVPLYFNNKFYLRNQQ